MKWVKWFFWVVVLPGGTIWAAYRLLFGKATMDTTGKFDFSSLATRELRQNNMFGVSVSGSYDWDGVDLTKSVPGPDGVSVPGVDNKKNDHLQIFQTFQGGMDAAAWLLLDSGNYFGNGDNNIIEIGNHWAGDKHFTNQLNLDGTLNPDKIQVSDYAYDLWRVLKSYIPNVNPFAALHFATDGHSVMKSIARLENGSLQVAQVPDGMYLAAVAYAFN